MLHNAKQELGDQLDITWRYFSLEQVNSKEGPEWKLWDQPETYPSRGRWAWKGAEAARKQGQEAFERFHLALLTARHVDGQELTNQDTIINAARSAELDIEQFQRDFESATLDALGRDHEEGVNTYGVFGTPTWVFEGGLAGYLRLRPLPAEDEMLTVFNQIKDIVVGRPNISEIKRPVPPVK